MHCDDCKVLCEALKEGKPIGDTSTRNRWIKRNQDVPHEGNTSSYGQTWALSLMVKYLNPQRMLEPCCAQVLIAILIVATSGVRTSRPQLMTGIVSPQVF
jgi:hypothetical protein